MKHTVVALLVAAGCASATAFAPSATLPQMRSTSSSRSVCEMSSSDKNADMMLKLSLNQMESLKGREGLQGKDADKAISSVKLAAGGDLEEEERKVLGSRRLAKAMGVSKDQKNEKIAFDNMFNSLQSMFGRDGFRGEEAEKALKEINEVNVMATAEESGKMLGSKRVYKFVRAATRTLSRPVKRKNHPGEVYDSRSGHR